MTLLNDRHPNELFRFVHVRSSRRAPAERISTDFIRNIYDRISADELTALRGRFTSLYPTLVTRDSSSTQLSGYLADLAKYRKSKEYIGNPDSYSSRYPALTSFIEWLDVHASVMTAETITQKFDETLAQKSTTDVNSSGFRQMQCIFWDNLIASLFSPNEPFLVTLACKYLGALHLAETVAGNRKAEINSAQLSQIYHAKPLVPKWLFEVFASHQENPDVGFGDQRRDNEADDTLNTRFNVVNEAIEEVRRLIRTRRDAFEREMRQVTSELSRETQRGRSGDEEQRRTQIEKRSEQLNKVKSPYELLPSEQVVLSATTSQLSQHLFSEDGVLNLDTLRDTLIAEATSIATKLGSANRDYAIRIADTIVSRNDICAPMIDRDPCATTPRKEFAAKGSFLNSILIGDLLVTKQQLIKYNTGEVAHVEAVMQGLEKQRTHRRLNRTETTTTFERESINESERELTTTERFSMEKETATAVKQDFQIKAGTNVSGSYGVVQFGATLDSSFGISQSQSDQTATSFSKDVTNRALSRVKETVREMQTITVINEVEETSLHKLTNDTGDNLNGVYCWLDKFYLNKIINYGRRMILEFTPPEPANNYLFQKMVKPQSGAVVEKPTPPSEVTGPDGKKLTSPLVLDDVNFAFWVAQYEAGEVVAPPQEFIWTSGAFKNPSGPNSGSDVYEAVTGEIKLPEGYEAIHAQANATQDVAGTTVSPIVNIVGTTDLWGSGYSPNILLPRIRESLSISIKHRGAAFHANVIVRAERSQDLYNSWKLKAYDKIIEAYNRKKQAYDEWLNAQHAEAFGFSGNGNNPEINRAIEREELMKRCIELFTGQRFESFDAATNGIQNVSGYPEILFREAITEGNLVKFFQQAFEWENMTYIFYPYFWGRKQHWPTIKNLEDASDPLFTKFLQAGYARVNVPVRPGFENFVLIFNLLANFVSSFGCTWNFTPSLFGALGISNEFIPGIADPVYMSVTQELNAAANLDDETGVIVGHYVQKVPTNLVYVVPNSVTPGTPMPGLPDNSADPEIQPYI